MSGVVRTTSPCACCEVETCWPGGWRLSLRSFPRLRPLEDQRIPMIKHLLARHRVRHPGSCHHRCELWAVSEQCLVSTFTQQLSSSSSLRLRCQIGLSSGLPVTNFVEGRKIWLLFQTRKFRPGTKSVIKKIIKLWKQYTYHYQNLILKVET